MKKLLFILAFLYSTQNIYSQTTIFFQGFEGRGLSCTENWGYDGGSRTTDNPYTGLNSLRIGRLGQSSSVIFNTLNLNGMNDLTLKINHSVLSNSGAGLDDLEGAVFMVSLNGSSFFPIAKIGGSNDYGYSYSDTIVGSVPSVNTCLHFSAANPINYNIPQGTNSISVKIVSVAVHNGDCNQFNHNMNNGIASNYDGINEGIYIDDMTIQSNSLNFQSTWTGEFDSNWFDCRNWNNFKIPNAQVRAVIDGTALNNCIIGNNTNSNATCKSLILKSSTSVNNNLIIRNTSTLNIVEDVVISKISGLGKVQFELESGSSATCNNLVITGTSNGNKDAELKIEDQNSSMILQGNLTLNQGASLDMYNGGMTTGTLSLSGDWIGNGLVADFEEEGSTIVFTGSNPQIISTINYTEIFHNLTLNKSQNSVKLLNDIEINHLGVLRLADSYLELNHNTLHVRNSNPNSIFRDGTGGIISENQDSRSRINWFIGADKRPHVFPFIKNIQGSYIPFSFTLTRGTADWVIVSTYGTSANNLPWPNGPVSIVNNLGNPDNSAATVDRFWGIDVTNYVIATLNFTYAPDELPMMPYENPNELVAQRYNQRNNQWEEPSFIQNASPYSVNVSGVNKFKTWTLSNMNSILPVEMLFFNANKVNNQTVLNWATASENNTEVYIIEKSEDAINFESIGEVMAVGFSSTRNDYNFNDYKLKNGTSYYRLKIVDFNNEVSFSEIVAINNENVNAVNVFPNPVLPDRKINFTSNSEIDKIYIFDSNGIEINKFNNSENTIQLNTELPNGVYYLIFESNNEKSTVKVLLK